MRNVFSLTTENVLSYYRMCSHADAATGAVTIKYDGPEKLTFGIQLTLQDDERVKSVTFV